MSVRWALHEVEGDVRLAHTLPISAHDQESIARN